jgi:REP element-mobilizing transposase RayT
MLTPTNVPPQPIYTANNMRLAYELRWSLTVFWTQAPPGPATWLQPLAETTEADGVRILEHRFIKDTVSQFLVSTKPHVTPAQCIRSAKGRLQYLVRAKLPKAFHRNYSIISVGSGNQKAIEGYVASQLQHHRMPDPRVDAMLAAYQFADEALDLGRPRHSSHGEFIFNLHLVAVNEQRFAEVSDECCRRTLEVVKGVARKKHHLLSRIGLLVDHVHWTVGCGIDEAPLDVGLGYLNNLAFAHGMRPLFQFGFYAGTFGPYDMGAVRRYLADQSSLHRGKPGGGEG